MACPLAVESPGDRVLKGPSFMSRAHFEGKSSYVGPGAQPPSSSVTPCLGLHLFVMVEEKDHGRKRMKRRVLHGTFRTAGLSSEDGRKKPYNMSERKKQLGG